MCDKNANKRPNTNEILNIIAKEIKEKNLQILSEDNYKEQISTNLNSGLYPKDNYCNYNYNTNKYFKKFFHENYKDNQLKNINTINLPKLSIPFTNNEEYKYDKYKLEKNKNIDTYINVDIDIDIFEYLKLKENKKNEFNSEINNDLPYFNSNLIKEKFWDSKKIEIEIAEKERSYSNEYKNKNKKLFFLNSLLKDKESISKNNFDLRKICKFRKDLFFSFSFFTH
jgi:hypothetical protein